MAAGERTPLALQKVVVGAVRAQCLGQRGLQAGQLGQQIQHQADLLQHQLPGAVAGEIDRQQTLLQLLYGLMRATNDLVILIVERVIHIADGIIEQCQNDRLVQMLAVSAQRGDVA